MWEHARAGAGMDGSVGQVCVVVGDEGWMEEEGRGTEAAGVVGC